MSKKNKKEIKILRKTLEFFPNMKFFKEKLKLYEWAELFDIELNGSYYPRLNENETFLINEHFYSFYNKIKKEITVFFEINDGFLYTNNKNKSYKYKKEWDLIDKLKKCNPLCFDNNDNEIIMVFSLDNGIKALKIYNKFISQLDS